MARACTVDSSATRELAFRVGNPLLFGDDGFSLSAELIPASLPATTPYVQRKTAYSVLPLKPGRRRIFYTAHMTPSCGEHITCFP